MAGFSGRKTCLPCLAYVPVDALATALVVTGHESFSGLLHKEAATIDFVDASGLPDPRPVAEQFSSGGATITAGSVDVTPSGNHGMAAGIAHEGTVIEVDTTMVTLFDDTFEIDTVSLDGIHHFSFDLVVPGSKNKYTQQLGDCSVVKVVVLDASVQFFHWDGGLFQEVAIPDCSSKVARRFHFSATSDFDGVFFTFRVYYADPNIDISKLVFQPGEYVNYRFHDRFVHLMPGGSPAGIQDLPIILSFISHGDVEVTRVNFAVAGTPARQGYVYLQDARMTFSDVNPWDVVVSVLAMPGTSLESLSLGLSPAPAIGGYDSSGVHVLVPVEGGLAPCVVPAAGNELLGLDIVYAGNAFFARSSQQILPGSMVLSIEKEHVAFNLSTGMGFVGLEDDAGNVAFHVPVEYNTNNKTLCVGQVHDDDEHEIMPGKAPVTSIPFDRFVFDPSSDMLWETVEPATIDATTRTFVTPGKACQMFTATTTFITSVSFFTKKDVNSGNLDRVIVSLYPMDIFTGSPDFSMPLAVARVRGDWWASGDAGGWNYIDLNARNLVPSQQYAIVIEGQRFFPWSGSEPFDTEFCFGVATDPGEAVYMYWVDGEWVQALSSSVCLAVNAYHPSASGTVQVQDPETGTWRDWQAIEIGQHGFFKFTVNPLVGASQGFSIPAGGLSAADETYIPPGTWNARVRVPENGLYEAGTSHEFDIVVSPVNTRLEYVATDATFAGTGDEYDPETGEIEVYRSYGDPTSITFKLVETGEGGKPVRPVGGATVFLQVGYTPGSAGYPYSLSESAPDYLYEQGAPYVPLQHVREYLQGNDTAPISYPYYDPVLGWRSWGPCAWMHGTTSPVDGTVTFSFPGGLPVDGIVEDIARILKVPVSLLSDVKLFIRAFYSPFIDFRTMQLPGTTLFTEGGDPAGLLEWHPGEPVNVEYLAE